MIATRRVGAEGVLATVERSFSAPTSPGSQLVLTSGSHLTLFNDGLWHDTSNRAYTWEQLPDVVLGFYDSNLLS